MTIRTPVQRIQARRTVEGAGFVVRPPFRTSEWPLFDPFLMLGGNVLLPLPATFNAAEAESHQAIADYQSGHFAGIAR